MVGPATLSGKPLEMPKPEIILFENSGVHGMHIGQTTERLEKEAMWKKQRVVMLVPSAEMIDAKVAMSWLNLVFPPNQGVVRILMQNMEVGEAYSTAVEQVLAHETLGTFEYFLTVETDNLPPPDGVLALIRAMDEHPEYDAISGLYFLKGDGGCAQIWGDPKDFPQNFRPQVPKIGEVIECNGIGMGFALFRMSMFRDERIPKPYFQTKAGLEGAGTQDLSFWGEARKYGHRCAVDCRVSVGHIDTKGEHGPAGKIY